jgi:hypothetical protein
LIDENARKVFLYSFWIQIASFVAGAHNLLLFTLRYRDFMALYVIVPSCAVGFISNILISFVLGRDKTMNGATRFLLRMLALADIVFYALFPLFEVIVTLLTPDKSLVILA